MTIYIFSNVSILVVLDVVLEADVTNSRTIISECFNPCCAGCSSGRVLSDALPFSVVWFQSLLCWM